MKALSREQVRTIDRYAIEKLGVPGLVLMENAGRGAADAVEELLKIRHGDSAAVVAGAGNNGGDGFVVARHLALRGVRVTVFLVAPPEKVTGDALVNLDILESLGQDIQVTFGEDFATLAGSLAEFDLVVDAVGGTGIRGPLKGEIAQAVGQINASGKPVAAIDIPTGLDCDTGKPLGQAVRAVLTVTFVARKKGFDAPDAAEYTGQVRVADIGIPAALVAKLAADEHDSTAPEA